jgi:hypothetical protein
MSILSLLKMVLQACMINPNGCIGKCVMLVLGSDEKRSHIPGMPVSSQTDRPATARHVYA